MMTQSADTVTPDLMALMQAALDVRETAMCLFDASDRLVCWNQLYLQYFPEEADMLSPGLPYEATLRRFYETNLPPDELPLIEHHLAAGLHRHKTQTEPYIYQRRDGRWLKVDIVRGADGSSLKLWSDVTRPSRGDQQWPELKDSFASSDIAFALYGADGCCLSVNKSYAQMVPDSETNAEHADEARGSYADHIRYLAAEVIDESEQARLNALLQRESFNIERIATLTLRRRSGGWLELEERPTKSGGLIAFWRDVTEQVEAQARAATLQQRLSDAIESLAEGVALYDRNDCLLVCNSRFREINAMIGDLLRPGVAWIDLLRAGVQRGQFKAAQGTDPEAWIAEQKKQRQRSGQTFDIAFTNGQWIRCTDRRTREGGTISVRSNITDLKLRETELARQAAMLGAIGYAATRLISKADFAATVRELLSRLGMAADVSRVLVRQNLKPPETGEYRLVLRFEWCAQGVEAFMEQPMADAQIGEAALALHQQRSEVVSIKTAQLEGALRRFYERKRVVSALSAPIVVGHAQWGSVDLEDCENERRWTGVETEVLKTTATLLAVILERDAAEAELIRQREALHQAEKLSALGTLLAGVAHELNNPLAIVAGQAQLMEQLSSDQGMTKRAGKIRDAAERCARIVKTFLAMARQRPSESTEVNLNTLIDAAIELTSYALRSHDIQVELQLDTALPPLWGDRDQLSQVLLNLIVNAQHALMDTQRPRRLTIRTAYESSTHTIQLSVIDNGQGVPEHLRKRIFEPFYTTKTAGLGTGIGLSICQSIVAVYGGTIAVNEAPGGGAWFQVNLPVVSRQSGHPPDANAELPQAGLGSRVLIVDDEQEIAALLSEMLSKSGYRCTIANSGAQALELLDGGLPDLILSDLRMPDLDGTGLYSEVLKMYPQLAQRFIFITGDSLGSQPALEQIRHIPVLEKPFDVLEVRQLVAQVLTSADPL